HDGDDDGDDAVGERLEPSLTHRFGAHRVARQTAAAPQAATAASASEISTLYPASDRPRKRHAASSQRTIVRLVRDDKRSPPADKSVNGPEHSCGPGHHFHSTPAWNSASPELNNMASAMTPSPTVASPRGASRLAATTTTIASGIDT